MKFFNSLHVGDTVKIALIVIVMYAVIACVTYFAW